MYTGKFKILEKVRVKGLGHGVIIEIDKIEPYLPYLVKFEEDNILFEEDSLYWCSEEEIRIDKRKIKKHETSYKE